MSVPRRIDSAQREELSEAAIWLQLDARYLYAQADRYRETPGKRWLACMMQQNAAHSAKLARESADAAAGATA